MAVSVDMECMQVYSVNWNMSQRNLFLTGSWDDSIKLWDMQHPASLQTFKDHTYCIYAAIWYVSNFRKAMNVPDFAVLPF